MARRAATTSASGTLDESGIPDRPFFKIGEAARLCRVKPYVLRYWETEFKSLKPQKTRSQQRLYRRSDVALLLKIRHRNEAPAGSKLEVIFAGRARDWGLPRPTRQKVILMSDDRTLRADFVWEEQKLIVELDGRSHHSRRGVSRISCADAERALSKFQRWQHTDAAERKSGARAVDRR